MQILNQKALTRLNKQLDYEFEVDLAEAEKMMRGYLVAMLNLTHQRLIDGKIGLAKYYKDSQMLACCAQRLNGEE